MAYYVKVTPVVTEHFRLTGIRNKTADGNYLLWQSDLNSVKGWDIFEKANRCGGAAISPKLAKKETDGVTEPIEVFTPDDFPESLQKDNYNKEEHRPKEINEDTMMQEQPDNPPTENEVTQGEQVTQETIKEETV